MSIKLNIELLEKYFSGTLSSEELMEINEWAEGDPMRLEELKDLKVIWEASRKKDVSVDIDNALQKVSKRTEHDQTEYTHSEPRPYYFERKHSSLHSAFYGVLRIAAAILILIGVGFLIFNDSNEPIVDSTLPETREVITERGQRAQLRFSDGSLITINELSVLRYPTHFPANLREVQLTGEAYFEINTVEKPFVVRVDDAVIKVLGTAFNISAWPNEQWVDVVVSEGSVSIHSDAAIDEDWIILEKNYRSRIMKGIGPSPPKKVDVQTYLAWLSGKLIFENTPLKDVLGQLERRYDVTFIVNDPDIYTRRLTASLKDETINDVITLFRFTLNLNFELKDSVVVVSSLNE